LLFFGTIKERNYLAKECITMMYGGMMSGFGIVFGLIYLGLVVYFFYLLTSMAKSLTRIANNLDRQPENKQQGGSE